MNIPFRISISLLSILYLSNFIHCKEGYFWHVTDMHLDHTYRENDGGDSCSKKNDNNPRFGPFGNFLCDSPMKLIESAFEAMKNKYPKPDFIIWTGDDTPHIYNDTFLNIQVVEEIIFNLTDVIEKYFPDIQCYSALGNHDWSPKSQLPPHNAPLYTNLTKRWGKWLKTPDSKNTFKEAGFYKLKVPNSKFTMIVLNTNFYYQNNKLTTGSNWQPDPAGQFLWLDKELQSIRKRNETAVLLGHVPPGQFEKHKTKNWFSELHNKIFVRLLQKYSNIISAVHMAHHHTDSFRIIRAIDKDEVVSSIFLNSAVTPWETTLPGVIGGAGNNPAVRLVKYDKTTGKTLDYQQFYLDLKKANDDKPNWKSLYNFTDLYGVSSADHEQMAKLSKKLRSDSSLFDKYYKMNGVMYDPNETCRGECKSVQLCSIENVDYGEYKKCMEREKIPASTSNPTILSINLTLITITFFFLLN